MFSEVRLELLLNTAVLLGLPLDYLCDLTVGLSDEAAAVVCLNLCRMSELM
ncbi:hypothetical protein PsAD5_00503 [Pseudovibrio sp. Ad5]|nr:hypothetical protein PsAD5_00503 [Pseudovibrio sp. Ad5]KZL02810.1 hypothetical protein PsW74_01004 [Pseudovibrio sp. W74]KZL07513.1 hypothetical protein PsAD14_03899 [Pseudovibrio sp. Ad14]